MNNKPKRLLSAPLALVMVLSLCRFAPEADAASAQIRGTNVAQGKSVAFEGTFEINYYCVPANTPVDGVTMYYWNQADYDEAKILTAENATAAIKMDGTGTYQTAIIGIAAKDLDKGIYVAFVYSDGTTTYSSGVLAYSIGTYCNASGNGNAGELAKATAVYGYCAKLAFYGEA